MSTEEIIKVGPAGNSLGSFWEQKGLFELSEIYISHGDRGIHAIQFQHGQNGVWVLSKLHGRNDGAKYNVVKLNYPSEFIIGVNGSCRNKRLCSLVFTTNERQYGPFGSPASIHPQAVKAQNSTQTDEHQFDYQFGNSTRFAEFGFFGNYDNCTISSIGVYWKPSPASVNRRKRRYEEDEWL